MPQEGLRMARVCHAASCYHESARRGRIGRHAISGLLALTHGGRQAIKQVCRGMHSGSQIGHAIDHQRHVTQATGQGAGVPGRDRGGPGWGEGVRFQEGGSRTSSDPAE